MIERQIVASNVKEQEIQEYIMTVLKNLGHSHIKLQRTPLGEKIIIHASRPGLIVGRKGQNIRKLTEDLKEHFKLENPQIEINEVEKPNLDAQIVAERIASSLEKFGTQRFKGIGHKMLSDVIDSGALGVEVLISGKIPSARAKRWRFYQGYLKKCGDVSLEGVRKAYTAAQLKTGTVGIQVRIMPPETKLPDDVTILSDKIEITEELEASTSKTKESKKLKDSKQKNEKKSAEKKETTKKKTTKESSKKTTTTKTAAKTAAKPTKKQDSSTETEKKETDTKKSSEKEDKSQNKTKEDSE